jgi:hypothetical protein
MSQARHAAVITSASRRGPPDALACRYTPITPQAAAMSSREPDRARIPAKDDSLTAPRVRNYLTMESS